MTESVLDAPSESVPILELSESELEELSRSRKLSLGIADLLAIRDHYRALGRNPTSVEIEVIAQTWSEHCKHRIFNARVTHRHEHSVLSIDGLFDTYIRAATERICREKPDFVLSAFHDNAGFIRVSDSLAACLKVETHNHPSAIEPYGGSNTGIGGVIRDILGAGKGAKPVASLDVFCLGMPDADAARLSADTIHPLGVFRGVVRGVRDYGNRMGIPTVCGAVTFDAGYTHNPLIYCGTAGLIPIADIEKTVTPGLLIVLLGGRTGRDGLHGATFSSASLTTESASADRQAVQIGNPIEEKKVMDCVMNAREAGLIDYITDCGAGGLSSAVGEMVKDHGGRVHLDRVPLKEEGLAPWEIFLSESQERMVLGIRREHIEALVGLAKTYETECTVIGEVGESGSLEVFCAETLVADLDCEFLHTAPRLSLRSEYRSRAIRPARVGLPCALRDALRAVLSDAQIASREPVIRQYDHEVQGNTVIKPLGGPGGDNPRDGVALRADGSRKFLALGVALSPQYGALDPYRMGQSCVDEAVRQLVAVGANPDKIAILDNFCAGDPSDEAVLGDIVECARGMSSAAETFRTPFISGKDSFYNCYQTEDGRTVSIPVTLLVSALGLIDERARLTATTFRRANSLICLTGLTERELGGSALFRALGLDGGVAPGLDADLAIEMYRRFHRCVSEGWILSAHDLSEGGLAVALAEMTFSSGCGAEVDLQNLTGAADLTAAEILFSESNARILFEVDAANLDKVIRCFDGHAFSVLGHTVTERRNLDVRFAKGVILSEPIEELKSLWKNGLTRYF